MQPFWKKPAEVVPVPVPKTLIITGTLEALEAFKKLTALDRSQILPLTYQRKKMMITIMIFKMMIASMKDKKCGNFCPSHCTLNHSFGLEKTPLSLPIIQVHLKIPFYI